jgi:hypothetical protein
MTLLTEIVKSNHRTDAREAIKKWTKNNGYSHYHDYDLTKNELSAYLAKMGEGQYNMLQLAMSKQTKNI